MTPDTELRPPRLIQNGSRQPHPLLYGRENTGHVQIDIVHVRQAYGYEDRGRECNGRDVTINGEGLHFRFFKPNGHASSIGE
jgi:hypothetical protein